MNDRRQGPDTGSYMLQPDNEASYHDPAQVRQWAASSTAGIDPFLDLASGPNLPQGVALDFGLQMEMAYAVSQPEVSRTPSQGIPLENPHGLALDYQYSNNSGNGGHCMTNGMATFQDQGYHNAPGHNGGHFDSGLTFPTDSLAYPTPITDDLSFFDAAGAHHLCHQQDSQRVADYSTEWSSQGSSQGSMGVSIGDMMPGSQPMSLTTSSQFGSSVSSSQSQLSHMDTPLSMAMLDESWALNAAAHGENTPFPLLGIPENMHLPPAQYPVDQRFHSRSLF
ncbi:MAG: hypothetical protein Q9164_006309 [Protoblastenia rupestris]